MGWTPACTLRIGRPRLVMTAAVRIGSLVAKRVDYVPMCGVLRLAIARTAPRPSSIEARAEKTNDLARKRRIRPTRRAEPARSHRAGLVMPDVAPRVVDNPRRAVSIAGFSIQR